jgi:hypothetical protein
MLKSSNLVSVVALAAALGMVSVAANAGVVASFSSLGSPTSLPLGATSVVDFGALTAGLPYNGGAIYNTGGGTTTGITNPSSFVAAPWTSIPVPFPPGHGYTGNFFADNNGDTSTWTFGAGQHTFYLYIGSLDAGNSLTITASNGATVFTDSDWTTIPGVTLPGDGNPTIMGSTSNGWFRFTDTGGTISSIITAETGADVGNSFEIAAIATSAAVPELSTWAMMGLGFAGLAFAGYRARRPAAAFA